MSWPRFDDQFLAHALRGFDRRRKALRHHGDVVFEFPRERDGDEWFGVTAAVYSRRRIALHLATGNRGRLCVDSTWREDRGKRLLRLDDMRLVDAASRIVAAFEQTVFAVATTPDAAEFGVRVRALWQPIMLVSVD